MQFKHAEIGVAFSRPVFGTSVLYEKVSNETGSKAGTAKILKATGNPELVGSVVTVNRNHVINLQPSTK